MRDRSCWGSSRYWWHVLAVVTFVPYRKVSWAARCCSNWGLSLRVREGRHLPNPLVRYEDDCIIAPITLGLLSIYVNFPLLDVDWYVVYLAGIGSCIGCWGLYYTRNTQVSTHCHCTAWTSSVLLPAGHLVGSENIWKTLLWKVGNRMGEGLPKWTVQKSE